MILSVRRLRFWMISTVEKTTGCDGFVWQCENHWQIENFYQMADEELKKKFEAYVRSGEIGLSGNYLNMTELVSAPVLNDSLDKMQAYGKKTGHPIVAGMSADINGLAWGYADALYNHGVRYFTPLCIPITECSRTIIRRFLTTGKVLPKPCPDVEWGSLSSWK